MTTPADGGQGQVPPADSQQGGQVPPATTGQQPADSTQGQVPAGATDGQVDLTTLPPAVQAYIANLRGEAANHRTTAQQHAAKVQEYERANETAAQAAERERTELQAERDRLRNENRDLVVGQALSSAITEAKAINPATVTALLQSRVEVGADGKPSNLPALISELRQSDPYLFRRTSAGAGDGTGEGQTPAPGAGINDFIRGRTTASR